MTKSTETGVAEERESFLTYDLRAFMADGKILVLGLYDGWKMSHVYSVVPATVQDLTSALKTVHAGLGFRDLSAHAHEKLLGFRSDVAMSTQAKRAEYLHDTPQGSLISCRHKPPKERELNVVPPDLSLDQVGVLMWEALGRSTLPGTAVRRPVPKGSTDRAVNIGAGRAWFVVRNDDPKQVAKAFGVRGAEKIGWADGCGEGEVFVSPVMDGWVLVDVTGYADDFLDTDEEDELVRVVKSLSRKLKTDVQFFAWNTPDEDAAWPVMAWASSGKLVRLISGLGFSIGTPTPVEEQLVGDGWVLMPEIKTIGKPGVAEVQVFAGEYAALVAAGWSLDPRTLDRFDQIPAGLASPDFQPPWTN